MSRVPRSLRGLGFACLAALLLSGAPLGGAENEPWQVINAGRGGDTTGDLLARLESDVFPKRPGWVVLLAGTNDCLNSAKALTLAQSEENLAALVRAITARGARLLLVTVPPVHEPYLIKRHGAEFFANEGSARRIAGFNALIQRVARENQVPVVDFFTAVEAAGGASELPGSLIRNFANSGSEDGVHPTAEGYRLLGVLAAAVIAREYPQYPRRIVCLGDSITRGVHVEGEGTASGQTYPAVLLRQLNQSITSGSGP